MRLADKIAIITGGGRGIGRSVAKACALEGATVIVTSRTESDLNTLVDEINTKGGAAVSVTGNVAIASDVERVVKETIKRFDRVDILFNNAGVEGSMKSLEEITEAEWDEVMNINVKGMFLFTRAVLPYMRKRATGNIINTSSGAGEKRPRKMVRSISYAVSKFAVEGFTNALSTRLAGTGVNVNALRPGPTRTSIQSHWTEQDFKRHAQEVGPLQEPEVVNEVAIYLASLKPGELSGQSLSAKDYNMEHAAVTTSR